jgi:Epoxide hydrolase N terminus
MKFRRLPGTTMTLEKSQNPSRRGFIAASLAALSLGLFVSSAHAGAPEDPSIRPFTFQAPQADLDELRRRINATRWPGRETVGDLSQGVQLAKLQELVRYWGSEYDWRKAEAKLNALPQFVTTIDGVDIHFIHVRSNHRNALPLIMTHGWPGRSSSCWARLAHSRIRPATADARRTHSISSFLRFQGSASRVSRQSPAGIPTTLRVPGRS